MNAVSRRTRALLSMGRGDGVFILATLVSALGCVMAASQLAFAQPQPADLRGRWVVFASNANANEACGNAGCRLTYDLAPCGNGWCGIEVKADKTCGRTAFRLDAGAPTQFGVTFSGSYERAPATQPYIVKARLSSQPTRQGEVMLYVQGANDGAFPPLRRTYPLQMTLARAGDAVCRSEPRIS